MLKSVYWDKVTDEWILWNMLISQTQATEPDLPVSLQVLTQQSSVKRKCSTNKVYEVRCFYTKSHKHVSCNQSAARLWRLHRRATAATVSSKMYGRPWWLLRHLNVTHSACSAQRTQLIDGCRLHAGARGRKKKGWLGRWETFGETGAGEAQLKGADFFLDVMFYSHTNVLCTALLVTAFKCIFFSLKATNVNILKRNVPFLFNSLNKKNKIILLSVI